MRPVTQGKERTGSGDRPGAYELYEAERGPLMWYLRAQGVGEHEAEDAIQAAFVRLLQAKVTIREPRAWLRTVALNEYRRSSPGVPGARRPTVVVPMSPADLPDDPTPVTAVDPAELREQAHWAHAAIAALPDKQRHVMARHYDGRSIQQIADDLGMSSATVRQNLHRARRALSRRLEQTHTIREDQP